MFSLRARTHGSVRRKGLTQIFAQALLIPKPQPPKEVDAVGFVAIPPLVPVVKEIVYLYKCRKPVYELIFCTAAHIKYRIQLNLLVELVQGIDLVNKSGIGGDQEITDRAGGKVSLKPDTRFVPYPVEGLLIEAR